MRRGFGPAAGAGYYGQRRRDPYRQQQQIFFVLSALLQQVLAMERKPPVTLLLAAVNALLFLRPEGFDIVPSIREGCLHPARVLKGGQWHRLLWSPFLHADEMHLYYNTASLLYKGYQLEPAMGHARFAALVAELALTSQLLYICLAVLSTLRLPILGVLLSRGLMNGCAVGFSAVLFGMKVVLNQGQPGWSNLMGVSLPTKYAAWGELLLAQLLMPGASFTGHLCGILAGLAHVYVFRRLRLFGGAGLLPRSSAAAWQRQRAAAGFGGARRAAGRTWGRGSWGPSAAAAGGGASGDRSR